ncbi:hypothetical protein HGRIS_012215 [Hohenbuehelia grisea]|uniref:serine C-palmitoyltransferase n=1 Tax=Hohenbuehelia grisea TaxID=104357 RepID=A0ABR3IRK0_9AGAR
MQSITSRLPIFGLTGSKISSLRAAVSYSNYADTDRGLPNGDAVIYITITRPGCCGPAVDKSRDIVPQGVGLSLPPPTMNDAPISSFEPLVVALASSVSVAESAFYRLPGSGVVARYVKSSHQNDPGRTVLEIFLFLFAVWTLFQSRTRNDKQQTHFIESEEKEIDELVTEWMPEVLTTPLSSDERADLEEVPIITGTAGSHVRLLGPQGPSKPVLNLATYNPTGLAGSEYLKSRAIETMRQYGVGPCSATGFYGTIDVHLELERELARFLGAESVVLYPQSFSTICSLIPAFCKRGDLILADRQGSFAIRKGMEISRSAIRWFEHNDLSSLEEVMIGVEREERRRAKKRGYLRSAGEMIGLGQKRMQAKYIIIEGIFERDGAMVDLPKLIELKEKYKYRLILDETISFGTMGRTGRGLTELYNVPVRILTT